MASPVVEILTKGIGELNLRDIDVYRSTGGYVQLERAVTKMTPKDVADIATGANLRGRGGAGFPTGRKWSFLPNNGRPRYLVCNCDEAEPGTFKDHMLLEETPHQIIEGILIGAYAIGCHHAFIYIRGEFQDGFEIMRDAVAQARAAGRCSAGTTTSDRSETPHRRGRASSRASPHPSRPFGPVRSPRAPTARSRRSSDTRRYRAD